MVEILIAIPIVLLALNLAGCVIHVVLVTVYGAAYIAWAIFKPLTLVILKGLRWLGNWAWQAGKENWISRRDRREIHRLAKQLSM